MEGSRDRLFMFCLVFTMFQNSKDIVYYVICIWDYIDDKQMYLMYLNYSWLVGREGNTNWEQ